MPRAMLRLPASLKSSKYMFPLLLIPLASCLTSPWVPMVACAIVFGVTPWWFNRRNQRQLAAALVKSAAPKSAKTATDWERDLDVFETMLRDALVPYGRNDPPDGADPASVMLSLYVDDGPVLDCVFRRGRLLRMKFRPELRVPR